MSVCDARILTKSRAMEYLTLDGLTKMTGVAVEELDVYVVKELVDNALDAAELTEAQPDVAVTVGMRDDALMIEVADQGAGLSPAMIREVTNLERFGGTKYYVKRPTRGAQGNALMTIIGLVAALWREQEDVEPPAITVTSRGERHDIRLRIDPVLERATAGVESVKISQTNGDADLHQSGTQIRVILPLVSNEWGDADRYRRVIEEFALWNPHARFRFAFGRDAATWEPRAKMVKRERGGGHGSPHWYTITDFEQLVYANVRALEESGEQEPTLEFAKRFRGCSSNRKEFTRAVREGLPRFVNGLRDPAVVERLFQALRRTASPPSPAVLGEVGQAHLRAFIERWELVEALFKYKKIAGMLDGTAIPFVLEAAVGATERLSARRVAFGINGTITYRSPFEEDLYQPTRVNERDSPWQKVKGLRELLAAYRIGPQDPVMVAVHLFCPNIRYGDYGKSTFATGGIKASGAAWRSETVPAEAAQWT